MPFTTTVSVCIRFLRCAVHVRLAEEAADCGVHLEQALVEQRRGNVRDRFNGCPAGANELDLCRGHRAALQGGGVWAATVRLGRAG